MPNFSRRPDQIQSRRITKSLNQLAQEAKIDSMSGAGKMKGDINDRIFKYELKTKAKPSTQITIKKEWYDKIAKEALENGRIPAVIFGFGDGDDVFSMRWSDFHNLLGEFLKWKEENPDDQ